MENEMPRTLPHWNFDFALSRAMSNAQRHDAEIPNSEIKN